MTESPTNEQLRAFGYVCEKCDCTVADTAKSRGGCDTEIMKKHGDCMFMFWFICDLCFSKLSLD